MSFAHQVTIGPEFFSKAFNDYTSWKWALVREFLQNSIDCGSNRIEVTIQKEGDNTRLTVQNDGDPMTKDILVNKLLTLGGSGKNFAGGAVGGFGKAKEILYYAHQSYSIHTGGLLVDGIGAGYNITETEYYSGTRSSILIKGDYVDCNYRSETLLHQFKLFASMAQWSGALVINGEVFNTNLRKGAPRREMAFGKVYTNNAFSNTLIVRINGIPMYKMYITYDKCVLLELEGSSVDCLASNRDVLKYEHNNTLMDFVQELSVNKRSALKNRAVTTYRRYAGEKLTADFPKFNVRDLVISSIPSAISSEEIERADTSFDYGYNVHQESVVKSTVPGGVVTDVKKSFSCLQEDFVVKNTTGYVIPSHFLPEAHFSSYSRKLVKIWSRLLLQLHKMYKVTSSFSVGFIFDESVEGQRESDDSGVVYYINPAKLVSNAFGKRFKLTDRNKLLMLALHEFLHHDYKYHDEDFASAITDAAANVMDKRKDFNWCFAG